MAQQNIEKWDPGYALLKPFVNLNFRGYFRKIYIQGKENIPRDVPVIFAPNHQNALMDALGVLYALPGQPVFLARSDIFKNPIIARILIFLKLLPIYRIRDGYGSLQRNDQILEKVGDVLKHKKSLVIFPEGNHSANRRLRPLKKGICRIAFQAEEKGAFNLGLQIVPVGLDYDNFYKFGHTLVVRFGKPISVDPFKALYKQNPSRAYIALKKEIAGRLRQEMIHIDDKAHHDAINQLREIYRVRMKDHLNDSLTRRPAQLQADQKLIEVCQAQCAAHPEEATRLARQVKRYLRILDRIRLRVWVFNRRHYAWGPLLSQIPLVVLLFPVFVYGLIHNALPFFLPVLPTRKVKDPQFWSSIKNGVALILFPLFYVLQTITVAVFTNGPWISLAYLISLPATGYLAYHYYVGWKKFKAKWRYNRLQKKQPFMMKQILDLRREILFTVDRWWEQQTNHA